MFKYDAWCYTKKCGGGLDFKIPWASILKGDYPSSIIYNEPSSRSGNSSGGLYSKAQTTVIYENCDTISTCFDILPRQILGSYYVAKETATILRQVVSTSRWRDANVLIDIITHTGARLASAQPNGNINNE